MRVSEYSRNLFITPPISIDHTLTEIRVQSITSENGRTCSSPMRTGMQPLGCERGRGREVGRGEDFTVMDHISACTCTGTYSHQDVHEVWCAISYPWQQQTELGSL